MTHTSVENSPLNYSTHSADYLTDQEHGIKVPVTVLFLARRQPS